MPVRIAASSLTRARARRSMTAATVAAAGALALSGCSADASLSAGVAAVVDGKEISVSDVQEATAQFNTLPVQPANTSDTLTLLIYGDLAEAAYTEAGLPPVPDAQLEAQMRGGGVEEPSDSLIDLYRSITHLNGLQGLPSAEGADIQVNPRFGSWDAEAGQVIAQAPDWITDISEAQN